MGPEAHRAEHNASLVERDALECRNTPVYRRFFRCRWWRRAAAVVAHAYSDCAVPALSQASTLRIKHTQGIRSTIHSLIWCPCATAGSCTSVLSSFYAQVIAGTKYIQNTGVQCPIPSQNASIETKSRCTALSWDESNARHQLGQKAISSGRAPLDSPNEPPLLLMSRVGDLCLLLEVSAEYPVRRGRQQYEGELGPTLIN
jgi:hypothetical protein